MQQLDLFDDTLWFCPATNPPQDNTHCVIRINGREEPATYMSNEFRAHYPYGLDVWCKEMISGWREGTLLPPVSPKDPDDEDDEGAF